ncbi:hypothetical protein K432DRAFT_377949 [Lepidopterella palustris CBS 459.81]|uniref:Yeast cell wall synthesis Kre9/Knh1-like N-terminal domain-containing protein n=1 Tax=Lepidopterella palustris CBS 459.81 TaxID=1314670 RepID=A0A8E2EKD6_9PEZI|nr:hypothetical protein K432DRAFT_377949 [Lepidopterella palustris CBS 459.81]
MRFFASALFAASALVSMVVAQSATLKFTDFPSSVVAGNSYTLKWDTTDNTTPITITLRKGPSGTLSTIKDLTTTASGGSYVWTVDKGLGDGTDYALMITQGSQVNYAGPIALTGGSASSAVASSSASATASSSVSVSSMSSMPSTASITMTSSIVTIKSNATVSTASLSATSKATSVASSTGTQTAAQGAPSSTGAASLLASSPLALIFGVVGAMAYLN